MKKLRCNDAGFECDGEIVAESVEEVMAQAAEHARNVHDAEVTPDMAEQLKALITDD